MSQRLTASDLQNSRIPVSLNICPTDERFYAWLNSAENLLLNQGRWWGSVQEARFCLHDNHCLTYPREVAVIEQIQVCGTNIDTQNSWYSFTRILAATSLGFGGQGVGFSNALNATGRNQFGQCSSGWPQQQMEANTAASFSTTRGTDSTIRSYPTLASDVGKKIIYQGRDKNGIWVRTLIDGVMSDGEQVVLTLPFVDTVTVWGPGAPVAVQKEVTDQRVLAYAFDTVALTERALAEYQPGETRPSYRQATLQQLRSVQGGCCGTNNTGTQNRLPTTLTALVSLQHVEIRSPGDWMILQNLDAYESAMMAVKAKEERDYPGFLFNFYGTAAAPSNGRGAQRVINRGGAIPLLVAEQRRMSGDRTSVYSYIDETQKYPATMLGFR